MPIAPRQFFRPLIINFPLRWVLTVPFILPTIGAVVVVGYLSYRNAQIAVENLGHQLVEETNARVTQELKEYLQTPILINRLNVDAVNQGLLDVENVSALESTLFYRLQQFEQVSAVFFATPQGRFRLVDRLPELHPALYLVVADPPRPEQISIYRLNRDGSPGELVQTNEGLDVRYDRPWYQRAVATGQPGWNPISQYGSLEFLTLDASQPVYDRTNGQLLGVFAVHIRLDYLSEFLHSLNISRDGRVIIMDQSGALLATSTREQPHQFVDGTGYHKRFVQRNIADSQDDLTRSLGAYLRDRPDLLGVLDETHDFDFRYNGELQYVKISPYQDQYGLNWRIVTVIPKSHFSSAIQTNARQTLLLCLLTLATAVLLGMLAADKLTARLAQLNRASQKLSAGNLNQRLPTDSIVYELNGLAQAFNQMADQLQLSFDRIQTALEESEEKFTIVFRTSPDPMAIATLAEGRMLEVNDSLLEFFGYARAEMVGRTALELNLWCSLDQRQHYRALLQRQRSIRNLETQLRTKFGEIKTVLLSAEIRTLEGQDCLIVAHRDITERARLESDRKAAEIALRESEERFRQIAENINQLFFVRSAETGQFLYISPAYEKIWGRTCESLYQNPDSWLETLHPDDRLYVLHSIQTQTQGIPTHREYRILRPSGEVRWIAAEISLIVNKTGQTLSYTGFAEDITDRKQTEQALQEREAMLRAIGDNLPKGFIYQRVYEPGKGFYYSYISAGIERLLGLKPETVLENPKAIRGVGFAEDLAHADQVIQESLTHLTPIELQMRNRTINGDIQWSSIRSTPRRLADGRIVWDGIEVDITDLKRAEAALRASEEQFRRAFDDAPTGVSLVRITGQFVKVNARYCDLLGYTEAELLLMTFQEITHPADLDKDLEGLQRMLTGEIDSFQLEKRYITKQGAIVPVLMHAALIYDPDGQPLYSVGHVQDIRDRLKVERMKEEFISVVSHELRTPLTSIRGALGILGSGVFDDRPEKAKHMLQIAINNSDRLVNLVNDILNLERLKSGKVQLVREQCQVADLMHQAIDSVQPIADQAEITLSCIPLFTILWAAPDAIIQTLINLLSNAIKFSSAGGTVWLKAEMKGEWGVGSGEIENREVSKDAAYTRTGTTTGKEQSEPLSSHSSSPAPYILFSIKDQGRGIPQDKLEIIFEQFQQVDVSASRKKGGTGLGLVICKNIVQQHGGQIWAESRLGEESTFYFTLPLLVGDDHDKADSDCG